MLFQGSDILDRLIDVGIRGVAIRVAQNDEIGGYANTIELTNRANASVRSLNFSHWFDGGILHTKFWNVDNQHFYVGSANLDWRSLTQVHRCASWMDFLDTLYLSSFR